MLAPRRDAREIFIEAVRCHQTGRIDDAMALYENALSLKPDYADVHNNLGVILAAQGRIGDAIARFERAIKLNPQYAAAHNNLSNSLAATGRVDDAIAHFERARALSPGHFDAENDLGAVLLRLGRIGEAVAHYQQVLAVNPGNIEAHNSLGTALMDQGKFDIAAAHYRLAIAFRPDYAEAHYNLAIIKTFRHGDPDLAALEALARRDDLPAGRMPFVHFALAKALDDCGDYVRAFEHLSKGNELKRRQIQYDEENGLAHFKRVAAVFDCALLERFRGAGDPSPAPIFVLGMPRSGSSLIEQILASHPEIHGAGELNALEMAANSVLNAIPRQPPYPECIPALDAVALRRIGQSYVARLLALGDGKVRIVDKSPGNFLLLGLIRLILPNARIIHTTRDPIDTCLSCYSRLFTTGQHYTYDLAELGRCYRAYRQLMAHWRSVLRPGAMLEVDYADVVNDLEGQARRLIDYCGLPWDDRCLRFHETARTVKTASAVQVRQPLFRSSLHRWRKYEAGLAPLLRELGDIVPGHESMRRMAQS